MMEDLSEAAGLCLVASDQALWTCAGSDITNDEHDFSWTMYLLKIIYLNI